MPHGTQEMSTWLLLPSALLPRRQHCWCHTLRTWRYDSLSSWDVPRCILRSCHRVHAMPIESLPRGCERAELVQLFAMSGWNIRRESRKHLHKKMCTLSSGDIFHRVVILHVHHTTGMCEGTTTTSGGCRKEGYCAVHWEVVILFHVEEAEVLVFTMVFSWEN